MNLHDDPDCPGWTRQTKPAEGAPHGWIQWKGTRVCIDIHCSCGEHTHFDGEFLYYVRCPKCQQSYMVNGHVELVPLTAAEAAHLDEGDGIKESH